MTLYSFQHIIYSYPLYTNPWTQPSFFFILFAIIQGTDVFQIVEFKYILALNWVTLFASLGKAPNSAIPRTLVYFPWYIS